MDPKIKTKSHFKQVNPHIFLLQVRSLNSSFVQKDLNNLSQTVYESKKKCYIVKGGINNTMNNLMDKSNDLIREIFNCIYDVRANYLADNKDLKAEHMLINSEIKKILELKNKNREDVRNCSMRVDKCEKDVGYHLLGDKFNASEKGKENQVGKDMETI